MGKHDSVASCAVCMDPLFHQLDDLDEEIPVVTTECGHAYHNTCILEWCKSQEDRGLELLRDQHVEGDDEPTVDDVQVVCPTCREECYRDVSTKKMMFTRLYLNFSEDIHASSGHFTSTPVKEPSNGKDGELMKLARGAKRLSEDVMEISGDVEQERIDTILDKTQSLCRDSASARSIKAVQTYFSGLTNAMNLMTATLRAHPLAATLKIELEAAEGRVKEAQRELRHQRDVALPRAVEAARAEAKKSEAAKSAIVSKQLSAALTKIQNEQTQRAARSKEADEREAYMRKEMGSLKRQLERAEEARQNGLKDLHDRTRQLKEYQAKSISRKELQAKIRQLEADNLALRNGLSDFQAAEGGDMNTKPEKSTSSSTLGSSSTSPAYRNEAPAPDESLEVDLPSFCADARSKLSATLPSPPLPRSRQEQPRAHPTSRTYSIEAGTNMSDFTKPRIRDPKSSKYWPKKHSEAPSEPTDDEFEEDPSGVIVEPSSPVAPSTTKRSRTNPFTTTSKDGNTRKKLKSKEMEIVDLCSTDGDSPLRPSDTNIPQPDRTRSVGDIRSHLNPRLGLHDKNGRPMKGLASGSRRKIHH